MGFTIAEKEARHKAVKQILTTDNLQALVLIGDMNIGNGFYGDFRYYSNNRIHFQRQLAVIFPDSDPILFTVSEISKVAAARSSFIDDCRISSNFPADVAKLLKEKGIITGKIGVNLEMLPTMWYIHLRQELPQIEWVETHDRIMEVRFKRSQEEAEVFRKGATLGDGGLEAALKVIGPSISEYEIIAEIEHYARVRGAEEHFTLIGCGKFTFDDKNTLPWPTPPSQRQIEIGDSIILEITPRYEGYWTQLVRIVNVGKPNADLEKVQKVCCGAIKKGLEQFRPGKRIMDVAMAIESYVTGCGYILKPPLGHICGIDLVEDRVSLQNEMVLEPGMAIIIHPIVYTPDGRNHIFWGETYLVIPDGYERLHHTQDNLLTI